MTGRGVARIELLNDLAPLGFVAGEDYPLWLNGSHKGLVRVVAASADGTRVDLWFRQVCCDLHGRNCEPPSELCCELCTEIHHSGWLDAEGKLRHGHLDGEMCSNIDLSPRCPELSSPFASPRVVAETIRAQKVQCPLHPPPRLDASCWQCARNSAFERAARFVLQNW